MKKKILATVFGIISLLGIGAVVYANPSYFAPGVTTVSGNSNATTSVSYLSPGKATTTSNVYDSYSDSTGAKADAALLLTQFAASSTASILAINIEYAQGNGNDCVNAPTSCDWYQNDLGSYGGFVASTTPATNVLAIANVQSFTWTFASTTVGGIAVTNANSATSSKALLIPTPARYTRVVYSITGAAGAVWGQIVPRKEQP